MFVGEHTVTLDAKGRITMPVRYRDELRQMCGGDMVATINPDGYLLLFPKPRWSAFAQRFANVPQDTLWLKRLFLGNAAEGSMDASGRFTLPARLTTFAKLDKDIRLVGVGDYFELWRGETKDDTMLADLARWNEARKDDAQVQIDTDRDNVNKVIF